MRKLVFCVSNFLKYANKNSSVLKNKTLYVIERQYLSYFVKEIMVGLDTL